jgi:biopolymer transport protein ExbD
MRALMQAAGETRKIPFVISADGKAPHQSVVTVLDIASKLGFSRITFATKSVIGQ